MLLTMKNKHHWLVTIEYEIISPLYEGEFTVIALT